MSLTITATNTSTSTEVLRYGAYVCLSIPSHARAQAARAPVTDLADRLGLQNEFSGPGADPPQAIAFLRRIESTPAELEDDGLLNADTVVHVAATTQAPVAAFCNEVQDLLGSSITSRVLSGVVRPQMYTGRAMFEFAYEHRVMQQPGTALPNAFIVPLRKTDKWFAKGWMERHTYFLPRFDTEGHMLNEGHALAAAPGIACLLRRTYKHPSEPAPDGTYDFVTYFECADADVPTFHAVCDALRDTRRNPEWTFVREGPTWHGRRVATWAELFS
jgi:hypothetical protein